MAQRLANLGFHSHRIQGLFKYVYGFQVLGTSLPVYEFMVSNPRNLI